MPKRVMNRKFFNLLLKKKSITFILIVFIVAISYFVAGNEYGVLHRDSIGFKWYKAEMDTRFSGRSGHSTVVFRNRLWLIGGFDGTQVKNDIWYSHDGLKWNFGGNAPFKGRSLFASVVFRGKLFVIGGLYFDREHNIRDLNDIWSSHDGKTWQLVTSNADFSPRGGHSVFVFKNRMWLVSGITEKSDLWVSLNGKDWTPVIKNAPFGARGGAAVTIFNKKIWLIGGFFIDNKNNFHSLSDVWYSPDGKKWFQTVKETSFFAGGGHTSLSLFNRIWVMGGFRKSGTVTMSGDGVNWEVVDNISVFGERVAHTCTVFKDRIYIIGGYNGTGHMNDIWYSQPVNEANDNRKYSRVRYSE